MTFDYRDAPRPTNSSLPRLLALVALVVIATLMAACNTTEGLGKDVKHLGSNVEDSAARNK